MKIIFWGNGNRGAACLQALHDGRYDIDLVVTHTQKKKEWYRSVFYLAKELGIETASPEDPNSAAFEKFLKARRPDVFVLAGYGKILKPNVIGIPAKMCINLHAGRLPEYRGSSPMNWALINGEKSFGLSIVKVDAGIDTGDVIIEGIFEIGINDTINDLHRIANDNFPEMLIKALGEIEKGAYALKKQDNSKAAYYPLRFPEDGLVLWDLYTAQEAHNRIRALTDPYPCAFTYFNGREVKLLSSRLCDYKFCGEPGRIYKKSREGLLISASDRSLWIREAYFKDDGSPLAEGVNRYDRLATVKMITPISKRLQRLKHNRCNRKMLLTRAKSV